MEWKARFKNRIFWVNIALSIFAPIFCYFGLTVEDITSWGLLKDILVSAIKDPRVVFAIAVGIWNTIIDPTTKGVTDKVLPKVK